MKRLPYFTIAASTCLFAASVFAGGAVDKVTGDFTQGNCWSCAPGDVLGQVAHRLVSAHEPSGKHQQKGFFLSWRDDGSWWQMDFRDEANTCVHVYADGHARIGGLMSDGRRDDGTPAPQIGRYFGIFLVDEAEPAYFLDHGLVYRFSTDYWSDAARQQFLDWCNTGNLPPDNERLTGFAVWPNVVIEGNLQVHNSPTDGD
jgi:hypothetical protein